MKTKYHIEITKKALQTHFSGIALETIIKANIKQDKIQYQFGHDYIHFDGSAFTEGFQYISEQEKRIITHLERAEQEQARAAFGRLIHSWQDFFSHSNYIKLWMNNHPHLPPEEIVIDAPEIIHHPNLRSGKNYGLIELFAMIPWVSSIIKPIMPADSHARMNLDSPSDSQYFDFAYCAGFKATVAAYERIIQHLTSMDTGENMRVHFTGKQIGK